MLECCEDRTVPTATVTAAKIADAVEGGSHGLFRLTRTGDTGDGLTVLVTIGGTATSGEDYTAINTLVSFATGSATADVDVEALPDGAVDPGETIVLTVTTSGMDDYTAGDPASATMTIADATPVISVTASDTFRGSATGGFGFTRTGDTSQPLTVMYTVGGTAVAGEDYTELSGLVTFAAGADRAEVPVEALVALCGRTVTVTIDDGLDYAVGEGAGTATVTIADQPLTVSVVALADGAEVSGGSPVNATFRFLRSGDISEELTVTYTVTGTATSGSDYTALSGSVTFGADADHVDVTVAVQNDALAEPTETVTATLDTSADFLLGNDSDTVFITDANTNRVIWVSTGSTDWTVASNWLNNAVPTQYDDVYFDGSYSNVNCTNAGYGLTGVTLYGLHLNGYNGAVTLANALTVGTFEQTDGTLNQPSARDLTITGVMLWSNGTLNSSDTGASVIVDGGAGRIDPPDLSSMDIASTLKVLNGAAVTVLPGTLNFTAGNGMFVAAEGKVRVLVGPNLAAKWQNPNATNTKIDIAWNAKLELASLDASRVGECYCDVPIVNAGTFLLLPTVHLEVKGHANGDTGPSFLQTNGVMGWWTGSNIVAEFGMTVASGNLNFFVVKPKTAAIVRGDFTLGVDTLSASITFAGASEGRFEVQGNVTWNNGTYKPRIDGNTPGKNDRWLAIGRITVGSSTAIDPSISNVGNAGIMDKWTILVGLNGITTALPADHPSDVVGTFSDHWYAKRETMGNQAWWDLRTD